MQLPRIAFVTVGIVAAAVALLLFAGLVLVPWLAPARLEAAIEEQLAVDATVDDVRLELAESRLRISGVRLEQDGEVVAALASGAIDLSGSSLLRGRVIIEGLELDEPELLVQVAENGTVSVAGVSVGAEDASEPDAEPASDGVTVRIENVAVREGRLRLSDRSEEPAAEYAVAPIAFRMSHLSVGRRLEPGVVDLTAALEAGSLSIRGETNLDPLRVDLEIELRDLDLGHAQPYLARRTRAEFVSGTLNARARVVSAGDEREEQPPAIEGELTIEGLTIREVGTTKTLLEWEKLVLDEIRFGQERGLLRIGGVALTGPKVDLAIEASGETNLGALVKPSDAVAGDDEPMEVEVGKIQVTSGEVHFTDRGVDPVYSLQVEQLVAELDQFTTQPEGRTKVRVSGKLDGHAPLAVDGSLAPLDTRSHLDLRASVKQLELSGFTPYSRRYVGNEIDGGRGSLDVQVSVRDAQVSGDNELVIEYLDFGKRVASKEATLIPVPAAAVLLADHDGAIRLDLPVSGNLDDPEFSYTGTLLRTLRSLVLRVASTPFALVGGMVSLGGALIPANEVGDVAFEAGTSELAAGAEVKLGEFAGVLSGQSDVEVEIRGAASVKADGSARDLRVLARRRAEHVRELLVAAGVEAARIHLGDARILRGKSDDRPVQARIELR